jgi:hypothetical protein
MNNYTSIITTHQARLRCMLHDIISKNPDLMNKKSELHRFQNGCIIHLEILPTTLKLSLLHNGEIDEEKPEYVYYVKPGTNDPKANAGNYQIKELTPLTANHNLNVGNFTYNFYLIRHGQAIHNLKEYKGKLLNRPLDSDLTEAGKIQAQNSGKHFGNKTINYFFVSDLKRTMQTLKNFTSSAGIKVNQAIVLPCNHELAYKGSSCDGKQGITPNENKNSCSPLNQTSACSAVGIPLEWSEYTSFYDKGSRQKPGNMKKHCRDFSTLQLAIDYIKKKSGKKDFKTMMNQYRQEQGLPVRQMKENIGQLQNMQRKTEEFSSQANEFAKNARLLAQKQKAKRMFGGKHKSKKQPKKKATRKSRKWSMKYKKSINCKKPKGFSQKQHCKYGRKKMKTRKYRK